MEEKTISWNLLNRLPVYLNYLKSLPDDTAYVSASHIAKALGFGAVLVRKDLSKASSGGRRKLGYVRETLIQELEAFMEFNRSTEAIVVGAGKLGQALLDTSRFDEFGLTIRAGFDISVDEQNSVEGKPIYPMSALEGYCRENMIQIGIITVPYHQAQAVCDQLIASGIKAIWNFAPVILKTPKDVIVQNENLVVSLTELRMKLREQETEE